MELKWTSKALADLARLHGFLARVFITENEADVLAFPPADKAIVIFGADYRWEALARAEWLQFCPINYWGDIDTHGFAILAQSRAHFAHVESLLMDRATLLAHEELWGGKTARVRPTFPASARRNAACTKTCATTVSAPPCAWDTGAPTDGGIAQSLIPTAHEFVKARAEIYLSV